MMLVEEGLLGLDDPVSEYLPELAMPQVLDEADLDSGTFSSSPAVREITIRHLLNHTSGLGYAFSSPVLFRLLGPDQRATTLPLLDDPGERWIYGESTRVLGDVVEVVSGQLLDTFMRDRIFRPLGMDETGFVIFEDRYPRLVTTHQRSADGTLSEIRNPEPPIYFEVRGDSRLTSTAGDYAIFLRMLLNEGTADGTRILLPETVRQMTMNQIGDLRVESQPVGDPALTRPFPLGAGRDTFGFGFQITSPGGAAGMRSPGSYSWSGLQNTHFWVDPVEGIAGILFMQVLPFYDDEAIAILEGFEARVYQSLD
jgi:CubicO group peptidase (beta-lactamase class C family)